MGDVSHAKLGLESDLLGFGSVQECLIHVSCEDKNQGSTLDTWFRKYVPMTFWVSAEQLAGMCSLMGSK